MISSVALTISVGDPSEVAAMTPLIQGPKSQDWRGLAVEIDAGGLGAILGECQALVPSLAFDSSGKLASVKLAK